MALRNVRIDDDPVLRKKARKVEVIDDKIKDLLEDMAETMYNSDGVGLACPQIGILKRLVTIDVGDEHGLLKMINPEGAGTHHRNHCPYCLCSIHVDNEPGDRKSDCKGIMEPISIWVKDKGEWAIVHRCKKCGKLNTNRSAADDNPVLLMSIAVKPLASPPFPLHLLENALDKKK